MELELLDLKGYGHFGKEKGSFILDTNNLPQAWEYSYQNRKILLKVDQHGPVYSQVDPPSDIVVFKRDPFQRYSSWLVWLSSPSFKRGSFTNFFRPVQGEANPAAKPDRYHAAFTPGEAAFTVEYEGVRVLTKFFIPRGLAAIVMRVSVLNMRKETLSLTAVPVLRPFFNSVLSAVWDKPEWYLKTAFCMEKQPGFSFQLMNPLGDISKRRAGVLWSSREEFSGAEQSYERFAGQGCFENPESVYLGKLRLQAKNARRWGIYEKDNTHTGYPHANAFQYDYRLEPGEVRGFNQVFSMLAPSAEGLLPDAEAAEKAAVWLDEKVCLAEVKEVEKEYGRLFTERVVETPDPAFNRYVNEWLPLQLDWTCSLDRGWPTADRGSRDSSNDFTAMLPLNPAWARETMMALLSCQRTDGWVPRAYAAEGRKGKHNLKDSMDAGSWLIELIHEYLCFTRDFGILKKKLPWLESDEESTVLEHTIKALEYYLSPENIGEHGLNKIRAGDWLDSVNRAGLKGRGETVTGTNQTIIALVQISELLEGLKDRLVSEKLFSAAEIESLLNRYSMQKEKFKENLLKHALNSEGYFNSVFNDDGHWIFSDKDPDGERRIYGPASWFSMASGVAVPDHVGNLLKEMDKLKCPAGYRLCWPPMGHKPIPNVGRGGSGDLTAFRSENANAYSQGSHGFLARGLAVAGKGDRLFDVLQYLLPYDQSRHPVATTMTPPYGVVNCWQDLPGFPFRGGMVFLTGSIAYGLRMVYDWMYGIRPLLSGLVIDPCVPSKFKELKADFKWLKSTVKLTIVNPSGAESLVKSMSVDGFRVNTSRKDPFSGRRQFVAPDNMFKPEAVHEIVVTL